ncbi:MAG: flagellar basal body-associated FliL family protein [Cryobacterium sp.]|nr:flagellar basal body-associated FliL family protein [Oligoflexia bacterium]
MSDAPAEKPEKPKKSLPIGVILGALNTISLLGLLGVLVYTQILYKRPKITENIEREKITQEFAKKPSEMKRTIVTFDPIQANLKPSAIGVQVPGGPPMQMKSHFLTMTIALELIDSDFESSVKGRLPQFLDMLLRQLGETTVEELSSVQGRFLLRSKIAGLMNDLVRAEKKLPATSTPIVANVYFSDFVVQ